MKTCVTLFTTVFLAIFLFSVSASEKVPAVSGIADQGILKGKIDKLLSRPFLRNSDISIEVMNLGDGKRIYALNPDKQLNPASVVKIATMSTAFDTLGPSYRFSTEIFYNGTLENGVINGNIYFRGTGDPRLTSEFIYLMASELSQIGIKKITGDLLVDNSFFDADNEPQGWDKQRGENAYYASTRALSVNFNAVTVTCFPGKIGEKAVVTVEPPIKYFSVDNRSITRKNGQLDLNIDLSPENEGEKIIVRGHIPERNNGKVYYLKVLNPEIYAAALLKETLEKSGIQVLGKPGKSPLVGSETQLHVHYSDTLAVIARDMGKFSNNFTAEQLLKTLGGISKQPASFQEGLSEVYTFLEKAGLPRGSYKMTNGSGLSHQNRFSSSQIVKFLAYAFRQFRWGPEFISSLSISSSDGTVRKRFKNSGPVPPSIRVKTGSIIGTASLAGYAPAKNGDILAFCIIINGFEQRYYRDVTNLEDELAILLTE